MEERYRDFVRALRALTGESPIPDELPMTGDQWEIGQATDSVHDGNLRLHDPQGGLSHAHTSNQPG